MPRSRLPICRGTNVLGVMEFFNRDILQPTSEPAGDDDDRLQPDRAVRPAEVGERGARPLLPAVARSVLRRDVRRLLRPGQSGVADGARSVGGRAAHVAVHGLRPPRRPGRDDRGHVGAADRRRRSSASRTGTARRTAPTSGCSGRRRRSPRRASSTPSRATSPIARPPRPA